MLLLLLILLLTLAPLEDWLINHDDSAMEMSSETYCLCGILMAFLLVLLVAEAWFVTNLVLIFCSLKDFISYGFLITLCSFKT